MTTNRNSVRIVRSPAPAPLAAARYRFFVGDSCMFDCSDIPVGREVLVGGIRHYFDRIGVDPMTVCIPFYDDAGRFPGETIDAFAALSRAATRTSVRLSMEIA